MEKMQLGYTYKNIPIPKQRNYKVQLVDKIEMLVKRMKWKAYHYMNNSKDNKSINTYGMKTLNCPPQIKEMAFFEKELFGTIETLKFETERSEFQKKLKTDIKNINTTKTTLTFADKSTNLYHVTKEKYNNLLNNAVTSTYKKANINISNKINEQGKKLIEDDFIINRMHINGNNESFITLKDHKENFANKPKVRLINPAKNELGRIAKSILDKINTKIKEKTKYNQWKDTTDVIKWFKDIEEKNKHTFIIFDIKDFYPSISRKLLENAIKFAKTYIQINDKEEKIIFHSRKSLLYHNKETWMKKGGELFDVTMGAYDGAEICELVGLFLLNEMSAKYSTSKIGLYRDDGLAVFKNTNGSQSERIKKDFVSIFKKHQLDIVIECNKKIVDYLDITLNLENNTYQPYRKPESILQYIHVDSNHPPSIIKQLPKTIEQRLSNHSCDKKSFKKAIPEYQQALLQSGYREKLKFQPSNNNKNIKSTNSTISTTNTISNTTINKNNNSNTYNEVDNNHNNNNDNNNNNNKSRTRKRKIIWFNPPFNKAVTTNIGKEFLKLIDKHFHPSHTFHQIFNRNTIKISYSCTQNMKTIINRHNKNIIIENEDNTLKCNCTRKTECPLNNECLAKNIVYEATITNNNNTTTTNNNNNSINNNINNDNNNSKFGNNSNNNNKNTNNNNNNNNNNNINNSNNTSEIINNNNNNINNSTTTNNNNNNNVNNNNINSCNNNSETGNNSNNNNNTNSNNNKTDQQTKTYIGISQTTFKKRYANHVKSFKLERYKYDTELSKEYWRIKDTGGTPKVKWKILRKCAEYNPSSNSCNLCLNEKLEIISRNIKGTLNKRSELVSKCRHGNKYTLKNFK